MRIDYRLPSVTSPTSEGKIAQIQSYLFQLVEELNVTMTAISDAQESVAESVSSVQVVTESVTPEEASKTFNSIKSFIIKSADIISAYAEAIQRKYDGIYVAQSDFGTYREETSQLITENSQEIVSLYNNLQSILSEVEGIANTLIETSAWTKSGLLEYDEQGIPIYGFEVGQKSTIDGVEAFNKFARFTAGGIYFYVPGVNNAVAWMTGTKLYITNAEITGSLKLGGFNLELNNGIAFKWGG